MSFAQSVYNKFRTIDVSAFVKSKNGYTYLPWAFAHDILMQHYPESESKHTGNVSYPDGTMSVTVEVKVREGTNWLIRAETLPVLFNQRPVENPNAFQINTAIKRCYVKCLGLHGLALYLYEGEDMPVMTDDQAQEQIEELLSSSEPATLKKFWRKLGSKTGEAIPLSSIPAEKKRPALKWLREQGGV